MSLKLRLIIAFTGLVLAAIILLSSFLGYNAVNQMDKALHHKAEQDLISKREQMRDAVESYFSFIEKQMIALSSDVSMIEATGQFKTAFEQYVEQRQWPDGFQQKVESYYNNEFANQYKTKNSATLDVSSIYSNLDQQSLGFQHDFIAANQFALGEKDKLVDLNNGTDYSKIHKKYHPTIHKFQAEFGFYDIFIVDPNSGNIVYSVFKELDFATSLSSGPYANTGIGKAFNKALNASDADQTFITDFDDYLPSYNDPASFISSPIFDGTTLTGVLIFQMPINRLNNLMTQDQKNWKKNGYSETGEIYLVGPNKKLRSESRFFITDKQNYLNALKAANISEVETIEIKNTGINLQPVLSNGVSQALQGNSGYEVFPDYRGVQVLSAYGPVTVGDMTWAILSEIDEEETFLALSELTNDIVKLTILMIVILGVATTMIAIWIANWLLKPINTLSDAFADIATGEGDLTKTVAPSNITEINTISEHFNHFIGQMRDIINSIKDNAQTIAAASESLGSTTEETTQIAKLQKEETNTVVESMQQFNVALDEVSTNSVQASDQTIEARSSTDVNTERAKLAAENIRQLATEVESSSDIIIQLQQEVQSINSVLEVINAIADQTNLLALNAAIEAARAGDHGRGFSVVADEVRSLAARTQESTVEIQHKIGELTKAANLSVDSMERASVSAEGGIHLVESVSETLEMLKQTIDILSGVNETVASSSEEQKYTCEHINGNLSHINNMSIEVEQASTDIANAAVSLSELSKDTNELVQRFRT